MASKKYTFLIGMLSLFGLGASAQVGSSGTFTPPTTGYDVTDSSLIQKKDLPQHNEFVNNAYPFPAKPRNQWEIGVKGGAFTIFGDVPAIFPTAGFGVHVRKALGYVVSLRLEYMYGIGKGLSWNPRTGGMSQPFRNAGYTAATGPVYDNYKTNVQDLSLEAVFSLNNIKFNKDKSNVLVYALAGVGATIYDTKVNALNGTTRYNFSSISGGAYKNRKDTRDALKNLMDDSYESAGETNNEATLFDKAFTPSASVGAGIAFRLGKSVNLAIEDRVSVAFTDLLDGQRYQNAVGVNNNYILTSTGSEIYNYATVGLNFNLGKRRTEPLWWMNPLDYAYNEINAPKHMRLPKPVLDDADGDGITDQFDREPNTPANAPVDSHGVSRDTDGDGVPDYKDKELVTPTQCQPVDADGVGKCPEPACCATLDSLMKNGSFGGNCNLGALPSLSFTGRSATLSNDAKAVLTSVAEKLRNSPNCRVAVVGYGASSKSVQQMSWDRVNNVINYLVEKEGISSDRFVFKYGEEGGDVNTVDLRTATTDDVPNSVPAPHPNLRRK